jgi:hypothetical protein
MTMFRARELTTLRLWFLPPWLKEMQVQSLGVRGDA